MPDQVSAHQGDNLADQHIVPLAQVSIGDSEPFL